MPGVERWLESGLEFLKLITAMFSSLAAIIAFLKQVSGHSARKHRRKQKSPHRSAR